MATTINLELKKAPTSVGTYPIYIRITKDKKHKRIVTSVALQKIAHWNPKGAKNNNWVRSGERDAAKLNDTLAKELAAVREIYREDRQASVEALAKKVKNQATSTSFLAYAIAATEEKAAQGRSNAKHYGTLCKKLQGFLASKGQKDLAFSDLSPALLADFEAYLQMEKSQKYRQEGRRLNPNYIRTLLKKFRALVNKAISEGKMPADKYPFKSHPLPQEVPTGRETLDESELAAIVALEYPEGSKIWHTKNAFLFSLYCAGIRAGDLLRLRWANIREDGSRLEYTMGKNHKKYNELMPLQARQILGLYHTDTCKASDYIFPWLDSSAAYAKNTDRDTMAVDLKKALDNQVYSKNTLLNKYLKQIAKDAGIDKTLSMHIARHTSASIMQNAWHDARKVQGYLAHSSIITTERYLHSLGSSNDNSLDAAFAGVASAPKTTASEVQQGTELQTIKVSSKVLARMKALGLLDEE